MVAGSAPETSPTRKRKRDHTSRSSPPPQSRPSRSDEDDEETVGDSEDDDAYLRPIRRGAPFQGIIHESALADGDAFFELPGVDGHYPDVAEAKRVDADVHVKARYTKAWFDLERQRQRTMAQNKPWAFVRRVGALAGINREDLLLNTEYMESLMRRSKDLLGEEMNRMNLFQTQASVLSQLVTSMDKRIGNLESTRRKITDVVLPSIAVLGTETEKQGVLEIFDAALSVIVHPDNHAIPHWKASFRTAVRDASARRERLKTYMGDTTFLLTDDNDTGIGSMIDQQASRNTSTVTPMWARVKDSVPFTAEATEDIFSGLSRVVEFLNTTKSLGPLTFVEGNNTGGIYDTKMFAPVAGAYQHIMEFFRLDLHKLRADTSVPLSVIGDHMTRFPASQDSMFAHALNEIRSSLEGGAAIAQLAIQCGTAYDYWVGEVPVYDGTVHSRFEDKYRRYHNSLVLTGADEVKRFLIKADQPANLHERRSLPHDNPQRDDDYRRYLALGATHQKRLREARALCDMATLLAISNAHVYLDVRLAPMIAMAWYQWTREFLIALITISLREDDAAYRTRKTRYQNLIDSEGIANTATSLIENEGIHAMLVNKVRQQMEPHYSGFVIVKDVIVECVNQAEDWIKTNFVCVSRQWAQFDKDSVIEVDPNSSFARLFDRLVAHFLRKYRILNGVFVLTQTLDHRMIVDDMGFRVDVLRYHPPRSSHEPPELKLH